MELASIEVLYEDELLIALNKPTGLPSAPIHAAEESSAVALALKHFPGLPKIKTRKLEPGLVHRLDTGTSGVLLFAKTQAEWERLRELWKRREVTKIYRAIVSSGTKPVGPDHRKIPLPHAIDWPLAHDAKSAKRMRALRPDSRTPKSSIRGKPHPARTIILAAEPLSRDRFDLTIQIETGVMHQIRCHLAALGTPIAGDAIYRGETAPRLWLHAWKLSYAQADGREREITAPLPESWP